MDKKTATLLDSVIKELQDLQKSDDTETAHSRADDALCDFLIDLGFDEVVKEYDKVNKWYA